MASRISMAARTARSVIFVDNWDSEDRHHGVANELLDAAAV